MTVEANTDRLFTWKRCRHVIEASQWQASLQLSMQLSTVRLGLCWCNAIELSSQISAN